jgi:hypothetical protein
VSAPRDAVAERLTGGPRELWHVVVTVRGAAHDPEDVRRGLERLSAERPFLLSCRYAEDRAEVRYWEEARDIDDAAALALRLWGEHRTSAGLPAWSVTGVEVLHRDDFQRRAATDAAAPLATSVGIRPF